MEQSTFLWKPKAFESLVNTPPPSALWNGLARSYLRAEGLTTTLSTVHRDTYT